MSSNSQEAAAIALIRGILPRLEKEHVRQSTKKPATTSQLGATLNQHQKDIAEVNTLIENINKKGDMTPAKIYELLLTTRERLVDQSAKILYEQEKMKFTSPFKPR